MSILTVEELERDIESISTCSYSEPLFERAIGIAVPHSLRKKEERRRRLRRIELEVQKNRTKEVFDKLMSDYKEIEDLDQEFKDKTGEQLPGVSILSKAKELIVSFKSLYFDSDEHYLIHLPNGNVKFRFSKGDKSWSFYISDHHISLIILDYIDTKFDREFPIGFKTKELFEISSNY